MRDCLIKYISICILFSGMFLESNAQISVKSRIDSSDILIGDPIILNLQAHFDKNILVAWPVFHDTIGSFEIINISTIDSSARDSKQFLSQSITLTHFDSGDQVIPPIAVAFRHQNDTAFKYICTDTFMVHVHTMAVDTSKALRPLKANMNMPLAFKELIPYLLILLLLLVAVLVYIYIKRKKQNKPFPGFKPKPKLPPHVIAFSDLRKLEDEKLWQKGELKNYHIRLTDIVRRYIEDRYDVPAVESTTPEIILYLKDLIDDPGLVKTVRNSLELSNMVKFAKSNPLPDENDNCLKTAYTFVEETKPRLFAENEELKSKNL